MKLEDRIQVQIRVKCSGSKNSSRFLLITNYHKLGPPKVKAWWRYWTYLKSWKRAFDEKLRYGVIDQSGIQCDWVNLAWTWIPGNLLAWFVRKTCGKAGFWDPLGGPHKSINHFKCYSHKIPTINSSSVWEGLSILQRAWKMPSSFLWSHNPH